MTLVILHGWGQNKSHWTDISTMIKRTERDTTIVTLDLPGFGSEPLVSANWGIPEYSEWVENKVLELKLNDVILLGHSFGGRISSYIAKDNPSWLKAIILYGAPCIYRPTNKTKFKIRLHKLLKALGLRKSKTGNAELNEADQKGLGNIFRKAVVFDQTEELKRINIPTLIVWGEKDDVSELRIGKEINTLIKNSKLIVLESLGHNAHLENPNIFYGTIKKYLENL
jgi:pimeloyl-ACP methyl ester carboxylesterase